MKRKCLLIDFGLHYKQINHAAYYWSEYDISTIIIKGKGGELDKSLFEKIIEVSSYRYDIIFTLYYLLCSFKYDKFVFLTPPEYSNGIVGRMIKFLYFFFMLIKGGKSMSYVKNINKYKIDRELKNAIRLNKYIFFESENQKKLFTKVNQDIEEKCKIAYVYYSDYKRDVIENTLKFKDEENKKTKVGLIGQFDISRRDYKELIHFINSSKCNDFIFYQVGRTLSDTSLMNNNVVFIKDDYTTDELDYLLGKMDILLSMNLKDAGYLEGKGTAAFSEAIAAGKILIIPSFMKEYDEFNDFCEYYSDNESFIDALNNARNRKDIKKELFYKYSVKKIKLSNE